MIARVLGAGATIDNLRLPGAMHAGAEVSRSGASWAQNPGQHLEDASKAEPPDEPELPLSAE